MGGVQPRFLGQFALNCLGCRFAALYAASRKGSAVVFVAVRPDQENAGPGVRDDRTHLAAQTKSFDGRE